MKRYVRKDQRALARAAADWAEQVLPFFEQAAPQDGRPRAAIAQCRRWARTGEFSMRIIRGASLAAHAAARGVRTNPAACAAAHAAGQAVASAHVPQHAYGAAYYALRALLAAKPVMTETEAHTRLERQAQRLPSGLRSEFRTRLAIAVAGRTITVRLIKGKDF